MKSWFLENIPSSEAAIIEALRAALPGQERPWILQTPDGDPIAYIDVNAMLDDQPNLHVCANVSGRHHNNDARVTELLHELKMRVGGELCSDD